MKKVLLCCLVFTSLISNAQNSACIIPMPAELKPGKGNFVINKNTTIVLEGNGLENSVKYLNSCLKKMYGFTLPVKTSNNNGNAIVLNYERMDYKFPGAYSIDINSKEIYIAGDNEAGVFYGIQTLLQLLPLPDELGQAQKNYPLPQLSITDYPRFSYRGMHLDVSRHFFSVDQIKKYIDFLATYKFNVFHWHLTDDQGWRIEIKKYPKLTSVGSKRNGTIIGSYPGKGNDSLVYGGFYSQQQVKEIVKYAAERYIEIIPEIEMPGHSSAAIAAYPQLSCFPEESTKIPSNTAWSGDRSGKQVQQSWGVFDDILCPSEYSFKFLEAVLDEVAALFPSKYIHIGGDEAPKESWKRSPLCQQLIKEKKLTDEHGLQSYFIQRIEKYVSKKGKKIIGWDEILEGGLAPNATVMSWRGESGGIAAAREEHDVIMTPENPLYLNHSQDSNEDSVTQGGYNPLENVYNYEPVPKVFTEAQANHILGAQGNMWSEHLGSQRKLEYMLFPRIAALSEVLWTSLGKKDWKNFENRINCLFNRLDAQKTNYSRAYYALHSEILPTKDNEGILWKLTSNSSKDDIFYTGTGIDTAKNTLKKYEGPLVIKRTMTMSASLVHEKKIVTGLTTVFKFNKATGKNISLKNPPSKNYPGNGALTLVDGIQNEKGMSRSIEFLGFSGSDLDATIDLGSITDITTVNLHVFDQAGSWIYLPKTVEVTYSNLPDTSVDTNLKTAFSKLDIDPIALAGLKTIKIDSRQSCRYVHIVAKNIGIIPTGNPGSGHPGWLFVDELEIN